MKQSLRRYLLDAAALALGSLCMGISVSVFSAPNHIAPGGVTGLATVCNYLWGWPIGLTVILINLPLLLAAWRWLGRGFTVRSLTGLIFSSLIIDITATLLPPFIGEKLLAALFGGVLSGLGLGLILSRGATTGGGEIIARLLERHWPGVPIGRMILLVDAAVIALAAVAYRQLDSALYAVILVYVASLLTDRLVYGGRRGKLVLIFSKEQPRITAQILEQLHRGVTLLQATGAYTGQNARVILCAVSRPDLHPLKQLVLEADPEAFFLLLSAEEVLGFGFADWD